VLEGASPWPCHQRHPHRDRSQTRTRTTSRRRVPIRSQISSRQTRTLIRRSRTAPGRELLLLRQRIPRLAENVRACCPAQRRLTDRVRHRCGRYGPARYIAFLLAAGLSIPGSGSSTKALSAALDTSQNLESLDGELTNVASPGPDLIVNAASLGLQRLTQFDGHLPAMAWMLSRVSALAVRSEAPD
jgi:hypothetical protein